MQLPDSIRELIDEKIERILDIFLKDNGLFHLQKISSLSKVPLPTVFRAVPKLVKLGFLVKIPVGKLKLYKFNEEIEKKAPKILNSLIEKKKLAILSCLIKDKDKIFHLQKISSESKVPIATVLRIISKLAKLGCIETIYVGKLKLYKISEKKIKDFVEII